MRRGQWSRTYLAGEGEAELRAAINIDLASIPDHVREGLAAATYEAVRACINQPGGKELLDKRIAARCSQANGSC